MADYPEFIRPKQFGFGIDNVEGGQGLYNNFFGLLNQGLSQSVKDNLFAQGLGGISGNINSGVNAVNENYSSSSPSDSKLSAISRIFGQSAKAQTDLSRDVNLADQNQLNQNRQTGYQNIFGLLGLGNQIGQQKNANALETANMENQYNQNQFKYEEESGFSFGNFLGSLLGAGGTIAGGILGGPVGAGIGNKAGRALGGR